MDTFGKIFNTNNLAGDITNPDEGDSLVAVKQPYSDAVLRTQHQKNAEFLTVEDFGAVGDGITDDTAAIYAALATGQCIEFGAKEYLISDTLHFYKNGQFIRGQGKAGQTVIKNTTNNKPLFSFSIGSGNVSKSRCGIENIEFVGNTQTTLGIALRGIIDDDLTGDADKSCWIRNIRIRNVGAGYALRVSSWSNTFSGIEILNCHSGLLCGSEFNANTFFGLCINRCENECIVSPNGGGIPASNTFLQTIAQYSGGTNATIDIQEGYDFQFNGLYLEGNKSPCNVLLASNAQCCTLSNVSHNLVDGTPNIQIIKTLGKGNRISGVINMGGVVDSLVRIEGVLPTTTVSDLHNTNSSVNGNLYDISTRRATNYLDGLKSNHSPSAFYALTSQNALEIVRSDTGAIQNFFKNGSLYFGADDTVPNLTRAGSTLSLNYSGGTSVFRAGTLGVGDSGKPIIINSPANPEGAYSAPPGSLCLASSGALYVKTSGTGNTGWTLK